MSDRVTSSLAQEALWLETATLEDDGAHNLLWTITLDGPVEAGAIASALVAIIRRHDALRTVFRFGGSALAAYVQAPPDGLDLPIVDDEPDPQTLTAFGLGGYDLSGGPLYRFCLFRAGPQRWVLACGFHHMITDGGSWVRFVRSFAAELEGRAVLVPALSYADYAQDQRQRWSGPHAGDAALDYWRAITGGQTASWPIPQARTGGGLGSREGHVLTTRLDGPACSALEGLAAKLGTTPYRTGLSAFCAYLMALTGRTSLPVGIVLTGRGAPALSEMIGYFVQLGLVRAEGDADTDFATLVRRIDAALNAARAHQDFPFARAVRAMRRNHAADRMPFAPASFVRMPECRAIQAGPLTLTQTRVFLPRADRDLSVYMERDDTGVSLNWVARADRLDRDALERISAAFHHVLDSVLERPDMRLGDIPRMAPQEAGDVARLGRGPQCPRAPGRRLHTEILAQAVRTPDRIAIIDGENAISYRAMVVQASRLAARMIAAGLTPGASVVLLLPRSADAVIAELAAMIAGGVFTPVDPDWPAKRIAAVLAQLGPAVGIALPGEMLPDLPVGPVWLEIGDDSGAVSEPLPAQQPDLPGEAPLYCIFTSGSTGQPKGAVNTHDGILNRLDAMTGMMGTPSEDTVLATAAPTTDTSIWLYFWPLLYGGRTVIAPLSEIVVPGALTRLFQDQTIGRMLGQ